LSVDEFVRRLANWGTGESPLYAQLAERIGQLVDDGTLPVGTALPSQRILARVLSVSRRTVETAYGLLDERGHTACRTGVGTWVRGHAQQAVSAPRAGAAGSFGFAESLLSGTARLDLSVASLPAHDLVREARQATSAELEALERHSHGYLPAGLAELKREVCAWFARLGVPTHSDQIAITSGAAQALWLAAGTLRRRARVAVENPTSPVILTALRAHPLVLSAVPADGHGIDVAAIPDEADAVFVTPSYLNPSGEHLSAPRCAALAAMARAGRPIVEDLALADIRLEGPAPRTVAARAPDAAVLSIGSMSKLFWGGLRIGWIRGPEQMIRRINRAKAALDISASLATQVEAAWLLGHYAEICGDRLPLIRARRDQLAELLAVALPRWRVPIPDGGLSFWATLPDDIGGQLCQRLQRVGITMLAPAAFDVHGRDQRHLRVPFSAPAEFDEILVGQLVACSTG
jgi:DNA-binding transcriptional MocR family regulator